MWKSQLLFLFLGVLFVKGSNSLHCYYCSAPCPATINNDTANIVLCTEYCKTATSSNIAAKGCSQPGDEPDKCWTSNVDGTDVHQCTCSSDLCNGAVEPRFGMGLIAALIVTFLWSTLI